VWYHMAARPQSIKIAQFKIECTRDWSMSQRAPDLAETKKMLRVKQGDHFSLPKVGLELPWGGRYDNTVASTNAITTRDYIGGKDLKVRRVRLDFVSCDVGDTIVLLPTLYLLRNGTEYMNLWDHLDLADDNDDY